MNEDSPLTENDVRADRAQRREQEYRAGLDRLRAELAETRTALDAARLDFYAVMRAADDVLAVHPSRDRAPGRSVYDALRATVAEYRGAGRSVRGDAPTEPPAVGLPVTLSSVDDVAAVCEQAGLDRNGDEWHADGVRVERVARQGWVYLVHRHWLMYGRQPIAELHPGAPSSLLLAAIEAARGGSR